METDPIKWLVRLADGNFRLQYVAADIQRLCSEVDRFAHAMKLELVENALQDREGWAAIARPDWTPEVMAESCVRRARAMDPVSAANYAMFLWHWQKERLAMDAVKEHLASSAKP
jgi:hypothetical protein